MLNWAILYALPTSFLLCFLHHGRPATRPLAGFLRFRVRVWVLLALFGIGITRGDIAPLGRDYVLWWDSQTFSWGWVAVPVVTLIAWALKVITFQVTTDPLRYAQEGSTQPHLVDMVTPCFWNLVFWAWMLGPWLPFEERWGRVFLRGLVSN